MTRQQPFVNIDIFPRTYPKAPSEFKEKPHGCGVGPPFGKIFIQTSSVNSSFPYEKSLLDFWIDNNGLVRNTDLGEGMRDPEVEDEDNFDPLRREWRLTNILLDLSSDIEERKGTKIKPFIYEVSDIFDELLIEMGVSVVPNWVNVNVHSEEISKETELDKFKEHVQHMEEDDLSELTAMSYGEVCRSAMQDSLQIQIEPNSSEDVSGILSGYVKDDEKVPRLSNGQLDVSEQVLFDHYLERHPIALSIFKRSIAIKEMERRGLDPIYYPEQLEEFQE